MPVRFEWSPAKAAANRRKHGVSFEVAIRVFYDPFALSQQLGIEGGEQRWQTLGVVEGQVLLLVAHTVWEESDDIAGSLTEVIRIISARAADRKERHRYEHENR